MSTDTSIRELELQNQHLVEELTQLNRRLEESEALKSHFISNVTNEIINPFTSIMGLSKSILSVKKEDWKRVITMVAMIHSEAFNLDFQLRNIFVAARIEAGEISVESTPLDVDTLLEEVMDRFAMEARKKKVVIRAERRGEIPAKTEEPFLSDAGKLNHVLSNLLSNALKFSSDEAEVWIRYEIKDSLLHLSVSDEGMGISESGQRIIFDRFQRIDTGISSINPGHGLGLSIVKGLLDILGADIDMESTPGKGTSFHMRIPSLQEETELILPGGELF